MNPTEFAKWLSLPGVERRPLIMGVLNVTPDSFYDGGCYFSHDLAYERAETMLIEGADIIDIGGESSRPGALPVALDEELDRVIPVIKRIHAISDVCISIDTYKPPVMQAAVLAGASFINDICALTEEGALEIAARLQVPICLMHMKGTPSTMQVNPDYEVDVTTEINDFFTKRINACTAAGIARELLIIDPGFGFGKLTEHNIELIKNFRTFQQHQLPLLVGLSRKSTIGEISGKPVTERLAGSLALTAYAVQQGASIIRTHDIAATRACFQ